MFSQLAYQLATLRRLLQQLSNAQYTFPIPALSMASIGGHTRHILELYQCLQQAYTGGVADYMNRERNLLIEQDVREAILLLDSMIPAFALPDKEIQVRDGRQDAAPVQSSYHREIIYQVEHVVHHLALIKVALHCQSLVHLVDDRFGMAYATLLYREKSAG